MKSKRVLTETKSKKLNKKTDEG